MNLGPVDDIPFIKPEHDGYREQIGSATAVFELMGIGGQQIAMKRKPQKFIIKAQ
jgi:hypothetical protein